MRRRAILIGAALSLLAIGPVAAAEFAWDGTWAGRNSTGRTTAVTIVKGKVASWKSNGMVQPIKSVSVGKNRVQFSHVEGSRVTMTPINADTVQFVWKGQSQSSVTVMKRR